MENVNYFDLIIFGLVGLLGLKGLFRGFIKEIFALIGIVGGVFIASRFASVIGETIATIIPIDNNNTMMLIGFVASLVAFWILAYILGTIISKVFSLSGLGIFDRFLGFVFGAGKVFLLFSIIVYAVSQVDAINKKLTDATQNSIAYPLLKQTGGYIIKIDTTNLQSKISNKTDELIEKSKDIVQDITVENIKEKLKDLNSSK